MPSKNLGKFSNRHCASLRLSHLPCGFRTASCPLLQGTHRSQRFGSPAQRHTARGIGLQLHGGAEVKRKIHQSVSDGETRDHRNAQRSEGLAQHVFDTHSILAGVAVRELAEDHTPNVAEVPPCKEGGQGAVHPVGAFPNVFEKENAAFRNAESARCGAGMQNREVSTEALAFGLARVQRSEIGKQPPTKGMLDGFDPGFAAGGMSAAKGCHHRSVKGSDAHRGCLDVQRGDVREADDPLGPIAKGLPSERVGDAVEAVSSADGDDGASFGTFQSSFELCSPTIVRACQVTRGLENRRVETDLVALLEPTETAPCQGSVKGAGRCDDVDSIARAKSRWDDHGGTLARRGGGLEAPVVPSVPDTSETLHWRSVALGCPRLSVGRSP